MKSSCLSEVDQLLSEVNVKLCEANLKLAKSFEVKSKRKLLPRVQMILSELEWMVDMSNEDEVSLSSCESLAWDSYNERKCKITETWELPEDPTITSYKISSIASISSSPSDEEEESLEDVFQTITPTCPTPTQPSRPASTPVPVPRSSSSTGRIAPQTGPVRTPDTSFTDTEDESTIKVTNERKGEPKEDEFVYKMSANIAALVPLAIYRPHTKVEYPRVDLFQLNQHFLRNIPKPENFPIQGCSEDPGFYDRSRLTSETVRLCFFNPHPFGSEYGYATNLGIVPVPEDPIHGYVWHGGQWTIYASLPSSSPPSSPHRSRRGRSGG